VRASRSRPAISNHTTGAAIGTSYVDGLTCPGWARTATASCQGLPSDVKHSRPHPGGSQSAHRSQRRGRDLGTLRMGGRPAGPRTTAGHPQATERSPVLLCPELRTGPEGLGTRSVSDSRARDAEERQRAATPRSCARRWRTARPGSRRPRPPWRRPPADLLEGRGAPLCVRRHRSASRDARPPRLRKSCSASVGAKAAARW
jgi:hypothetical protein